MARPAWLYGTLLLIVIVMLHGQGYVGGGRDDWYYLEAARCGAAQGPCLPHTHWAARLPVILPMAATFALAGISAWTAGFVTLCYAIAAVILLVLNVERRWGAAPAALAGVALALTPAFSLNALEPQVDVAELAWSLAGLLALQIAVERRSRRVAAIAGVMLALAVMTRMSALAFLPIVGLGWLALPHDRRMLVIPLGLGFAAPLAIEAVGYWLATGDAAYGWLLSLRHTAIPSTELKPGVDLSRSALFNMDFVRGWKRSMGIELHWSIDPLLNLLADPLSGLTLLGASALIVARRREWLGDRWIRLAVIAAVLHFLILTFVLAVDPKPRMFMFAYAVAAAVIGVLGVAAWRAGSREVVAALVILLATAATVMSASGVNTRDAQMTAESWIAEAPPRITVDDWTRRTFALSPAVYAMPTTAPGATAPVLQLTTQTCAQAAASRGPAWQVARDRAFSAGNATPITWLRRHANPSRSPEVMSLCLLTLSPDRAASPRG